jgi:hypothetical protein
MKEVGKRWQSLIPTEKKVYQDLADIDKVRYKNELKEFEKEVEKLQISKLPKGKVTKSKGKVEIKPEIKIEVKPEVMKSPVKVQEPIRIDDDSFSDDMMAKAPIFQQKQNIAIEIDHQDRLNQISKPKLSNPIYKDEVMPKQATTFRKDSLYNTPSEIKQPAPAPVKKDDNLIKRPLNIYKSDSQLNPSRPHHEKYVNFEYPKYNMQPDPYYIGKNEASDQPAVTMGYRMRVNEGGNENYNKIFPEGQSPPILENRKRNRRISSIVGVPSNSSFNGYDVEEMFDNKYVDKSKPDNRKELTDFNLATEAPSPYLSDQRKNSMQYFAGIARNSSIEHNFNQNSIFKFNNDGSTPNRKQSSNFPFPDPN